MFASHRTLDESMGMLIFISSCVGAMQQRLLLPQVALYQHAASLWQWNPE